MKFFTVLVAVIFLAACSPRASDDSQVRALISRLETAAEARDTSDVLGHVADGYEDNDGHDKSALRDLLRAWFLTHPKVQLWVNVESLEFPADGLAQAELTVTSVSLANPDRLRLKVEFRRQDEEWRVARADRLTS
jgi:hypothetical protein